MTLLTSFCVRQKDGGASDIVKAKTSGEDLRATGGLASNLPHPRVNNTKQHYCDHTNAFSQPGPGLGGKDIVKLESSGEDPRTIGGLVSISGQQNKATLLRPAREHQQISLAVMSLPIQKTSSSLFIFCSLVHLALLVTPAQAVAIRPVTFLNGAPTASSVIENPVPGQALWDTRMALDRSKVNILVRDVFCPFVCQWMPEFIGKTGIDIAVHCHGPSLSSLAIARTNFQPSITNEEAWKLCEPFGGNIYSLPGGEDLADLSQAFLGGFDGYFTQLGNILPKLAFGDAWSVEPTEVAADLSPFLSTSDFDWLSVLPALREISCTSGTAVVSLPSDIDVLTFFHQDKHVKLPAVVTWNELLAEMRRLEGQDRDGDGVADKPYCHRGAFLQERLLRFIASSFFQVRGPHDGHVFDLKNLDNMLDTAGSFQ